MLVTGRKTRVVSPLALLMGVKREVVGYSANQLLLRSGPFGVLGPLVMVIAPLISQDVSRRLEGLTLFGAAQRTLLAAQPTRAG